MITKLFQFNLELKSKWTKKLYNDIINCKNVPDKILIFAYVYLSMPTKT